MTSGAATILNSGSENIAPLDTVMWDFPDRKVGTVRKGPAFHQKGTPAGKWVAATRPFKHPVDGSTGSLFRFIMGDEEGPAYSTGGKMHPSLRILRLAVQDGLVGDKKDELDAALLDARDKTSKQLTEKELIVYHIEKYLAFLRTRVIGKALRSSQPGYTLDLLLTGS